jgi:hypothetical protein
MALGQLFGTLEALGYVLGPFNIPFNSDLDPLIRQDNKILRNPGFLSNCTLYNNFVNFNFGFLSLFVKYLRQICS